MYKIKYTTEIVEYIVNNFAGKSNIELSNKVNAKFGTSFDNNSITNFKGRMMYRKGIDLKTGINPGCYQYGRKPTNAIKKGQRISPKTEFKKGNKPSNWLPIGTERVSKDGYIEIKVQDGKLQKNWKGKHIVLWEKINGVVPKGHKIIFADGNKKNIKISNLILVSNAEMLILNRQNLISDDPNLTETGTIIAKVIDKTYKKREGI